ncbi:MAG: hypothetical protein SPI25_04955 [Dialister sp.]|nr:hypothetical protein [Dialister sp.]
MNWDTKDYLFGNRETGSFYTDQFVALLKKQEQYLGERLLQDIAAMGRDADQTFAEPVTDWECFVDT